MGNNSNDKDNIQDISLFAGRIYGNIIYWGTVISTAIALIGSVISFTTRYNYVDPSYMISSIWQKQSVNEIWEGATGELPNGHWYLSHIFTGNGITEFGLALGVFMVIPALLCSSYILLRSGLKMYAVFGFIAAFITIISMLGLLPLPVS